MAPGPAGGLYVLIPTRKAPAVLALLDSVGRPRAGWPVGLAGATSCEQLLPVEDGSVRILCGLDNPDGDPLRRTVAFAFDSGARSIAGWPVDLWGSSFMDGLDHRATGRVVGDELIVFRGVIEAAADRAKFAGTLVRVSANGTLRTGAPVSLGNSCCDHQLSIGPDGVGYDIDPGAAMPDGADEPSVITAIGLSGVRAGWPVNVDGIASGPALRPGRRIVLAVASSARRNTRVVVFDRDGKAFAASSSKLPVATVHEGTGDTGGCWVDSPQKPLVARDGTIFVYSEVDAEVYALAPSLEVMRGWPYRPAAPLVRARPGRESEHEAGYCPAPVVPAVGPDSTLYLALKARGDAVGGSLVAVGPNGKVRPGWPVELKHPGSEFWSVVTSPDATVHAVAYELEPGGASSATILAIAPDSTVLWTTTIIEP
jgi:hypothetical protein